MPPRRSAPKSPPPAPTPFAGAASVIEPGLLDQVVAYKRRVAGLYRPLPPGDLSTVPSGALLVSRKRDGEFWCLVVRDGETLLVNPSGRTLRGDWPFLVAAAGLPTGLVVAGELHSEPPDRRERVGDVATAVAAGPGAAPPLHFTAFDLVRDADGTTPDRYEARLARLESLLGGALPALRTVPTERMTDIDSVRAYYQSVVVDGGAEGLVIRAATGVVYKVKPVIDIDCVVVGFTEKTAEAGHVRSLLLGVRHPDGLVQVLGGCGNLGSQEDRRQLYAQLAPSACPSTIRQASDGGGLYTFVQPRVVVAVRVTDLQAETSDGAVTRSPVLSFDGVQWTGQGLAPCPRPIHPVLDRVRADKDASGDDVRFAQMDPWMAPGRTRSADDASRPTSRVIRRQVWTKATKGQVAVRKLLVWQTNKSHVDPTFPAYVVHWTDYSAGRSSPLDREVRPAPTEEDAMRLADAMVAENIKKGWDLVSGSDSNVR